MAGMTPIVEYLKNVGGDNGSFLWNINRSAVLLSFKAELTNNISVWKAEYYTP